MKKKIEKAAQKETKKAKPNLLQPLPDNETLHTTNPFTGKKTNITPNDLENMERWNEAQTERD